MQLTSSHLHKLQALLDVLHLVLVVLDHLLHLLAVCLWMDRVCDVGWSRRQPTCRSHTNAYSRDDEWCSCCEGRQNEASDGSDGPRNAGHPTADAGRDRLLMENVGRISHSEQLQDTLLEWGATLVEKANKKASRHEDTVSCMFHHSETRKQVTGETLDCYATSEAKYKKKELNKWISSRKHLCIWGCSIMLSVDKMGNVKLTLQLHHSGLPHSTHSSLTHRKETITATSLDCNKQDHQ